MDHGSQKLFLFPYVSPGPGPQGALNAGLTAQLSIEQHGQKHMTDLHM